MSRQRPAQSLGRKPVSSGGSSSEPKRDGEDKPGASAMGSMDSLVDEITKKEARF